MASRQDGSVVANRGRRRAVTADYGQRAAMALERCIPGPNRDKAIARLFGVSDRMARYLRCGQHWTAERLGQASQALGARFDAYVASTDVVCAELDRLEGEI